MELVLDTNIYRNLATGLDANQTQILSSALKENADNLGIEITFPIISAMELISRFNDPHPGEQLVCRNGLKLLTMISTKEIGGNLTANFSPPLNAILESYFQGTKNLHANIYGGAVISSALKLLGELDFENGQNADYIVNIIKSQIEFEKKEIHDNYENYLKTLSNGQSDWTYYSGKDKKFIRRKYFEDLKNGKHSFLVAQGMVQRAHNIVGIPIIKDENYFNKVLKFMKDFCPALKMHEVLLKKVGHGVKAIQSIKDERWNTILDMSLIFGAMFNPSLKDKRLVTEEKQIHLA